MGRWPTWTRSPKLTAYITSQAPHAHRTVYASSLGCRAQDPGDLAGHRRRLRQQGADLPYVLAVVGSIVTKRPVKWMEDRSSNLMTTGFARDYHMHGEIAATREGKIVGAKVDVLADHGAFNATAQPTKFPAGFFHIFTGSYDYGAAHCKVTGVYTNKAPGVAYACSGITEAVYLIERIVDRLAAEPGWTPPSPPQEPVAARAVPVHDTDRLGVRLRRLSAGVARGDAHRRLRRTAEQAEKGERGVHGHRHLVLHRGGSRAQAHGHPRLGMADGRGGSISTGKAQRDCPCRPRSGPRDDVRPDRQPRAGDPARGHRGDPRRRQHAVGWHLRPSSTPVSGAAPPSCRSGARQGAHRGRRGARVLARRPRVGARTLAGQGRPGPGQDGRRDRAAHSNLELPEGVEGHLDAVDATTRRTSRTRSARTSASSTSIPAPARSRCGASSPSTTAVRASTR